MSKNYPQKKIGLISGLGPLAGSDVLHKILAYSAAQYKAVEDTQYPEIFLISKGIDGFDNKGTIKDNFLDELLEGAKQLNWLGADVVGVACNTAHLLYPLIVKESKALVIDLIQETVRAMIQSEPPHLLLSSSQTKDAGLYDKVLKNKGLVYSLPGQKAQSLIDEAIHLVMGNNLEKAGQKLSQAFILLDIQKYRSITVGCTELPLAMQHIKIPESITVLDSNQILAKKLADLAYGHA